MSSYQIEISAGYVGQESTERVAAAIAALPGLTGWSFLLERQVDGRVLIGRTTDGVSNDQLKDHMSSGLDRFYDVAIRLGCSPMFEPIRIEAHEAL